MRFTLLTLLTFLGVTIYAQDTRLMTLQECVDLAIKNNLNVQRANLGLQNAKIDLKESEFGRYPNANAGTSFDYSWGRSIDPTTNQFISQRINSFNLSGNSGVTIYGGSAITNTIKQAEKELAASELDVEKSINDVQLDVVTFYLNVIFNKELLENSRYQLESSQKQLERTKKLVENGALPRTSELELSSQVSTSEVNVINAENNLNLAFLKLKQVMLLSVNERIGVVIPELEVESADLSLTSEDVFINAEAAMPEIKSADLRKMSAEIGYQVAVGGLYPTLSLNAGVSTTYSDARVAFVSDGGGAFEETGAVTSVDGQDILAFAPTGSFETVSLSDQLGDNLSRFVSLSLSVPIFNRWNQRASIQRSKVAMQQADINAQEQRNFLRQIIESAYNDVQASSKSYEAATKQVEALEETFRSVQNQLNNGAANQTDFQVASNNLFQATSDLTRAKFDYIFKKKLLDFYQGKPIY